jgi:hypothetical protein
MSKTDSTTMAMTVVTTMPMRIAPRVRRTSSTAVSSRPITKTTVGQPCSSPPTPSWTGTGPASVRRTKPASTSPISAMNRPMPTLMAVFSSIGIALKIAVRRPTRTRTAITMPSSTTSPMASAQLICDATEKVTKALRPSPVATANGYLPTTPIRIVMTAATRAVTAATCGMPRTRPSASGTVPMISGLRTTM